MFVFRSQLVAVASSFSLPQPMYTWV